MKRAMLRGLVVGITVLVCGNACFANTVNLLKNSEFLEEEPDKPGTFKHWEISGSLDGKWESRERWGQSSFWNKDSRVPYIELKCGDHTYTRLTQKHIPVRPDTWYVQIAWYKADVNRIPGGINFSLYATGGGKSLAKWAVPLGPVNDWVRLRTFFHSGTNSSIAFTALFSGKGNEGAFCFGSCEMREMAPSDMHGPYLVDGSFEKGITGNQPTDFRTRKGILTISEGGIDGGLSMKVNVPKHNNAGLSAREYRVQCIRGIPAKTGDTVSLSFMARADVAGFNLAAGMFDGDGWVHSEYKVLSSDWKRVQLTTVVSDRGEKAPQGIQLLAFNFQGSGSADNLWIDDVSFSVESRQPELGLRMPGINRVMNSSFEAGLVGWTWVFRKYIRKDTPTGSVTLDDSTAAEGTHSLRIHIPGGGGDSLNLSNIFFPAQAGDTFTISFWAKTDNSAPVSVGLTPRTTLFGGTINISDTWQRYHIQVTLAGKPKEYLAKLKGYVALVMTAYNPGTYWIDAVQVEHGSHMTDYAPSGDLEVGAVCDRTLYPCYLKGETPKAVVYLCSRLERTSGLTLGYDTVDWRGQTVCSREETVTVPAGKTIPHDIDLFSGLTGAFVTRLTLSDSATGTSASAPLLYGLFPKIRDVPPEQTCFGIQGSYFIGSHRGYYYLKGGTLDDLFQLARLRGIRWWCTGGFVTWFSIEPEQDKWQWMDRYVDTCLRNGIRMLPIFSRMGRTPKWAYSHKLCDRPVYADIFKARGMYYPKMELWNNYVRTVVKHYAGKIDVYEYMSETGDCSAPSFIEYAEAAYNVIKELDPKIRVVGPSGWCCSYGPEDDWTFAGRVLKGGIYDLIDVFSAHWYPTMGDNYGLRYGVKQPVETGLTTWGPKPASLFKGMEYLETAYGDKPVWDTESAQGGAPQVKWMFNPYHIPVNNYCSAKAQADRHIRWSVIKFASGISRIFGHMQIGNSPLNSSFHVCPFECNFAPKPMAVASTQMARRLDGFTFIRKATLAGTTMIFLFEVEGKPLGIYWDYAAETPREITLRISPESIIAEDLMGNEIKVDARNSSITLPLGRTPVYIIGRTIHPDTLFRAFENAQISGGRFGDLGVTFGHRTNKPAILVGLRNVSTSPLSGKIEIAQIPREWEVAHREEQFIDVPPNTDQVVSIPLTSCRAVFKKACLAVTGTFSGNNLEAKRASVLTANVPAKQGKVTIDGRITDSEYGKLKTISLGESDQLIDRGAEVVTPSASAAVRIVWDEKAIYIGIEVEDDKIVVSSNGSELYAGDCVEVYVDTETSLGMFEDVYVTHEGKYVQGKFPCAPIEPGKFPARYQIQPASHEILNIAAGEIELASERRSDGYTLEVKIPTDGWELKSGTVIGFDLKLIDYDRQISGNWALAKKVLCAWTWSGIKPQRKPHGFGFLVLVD